MRLDAPGTACDLIWPNWSLIAAIKVLFVWMKQSEGEGYPHFLTVVLLLLNLRVADWLYWVTSWRFWFAE